jgi:prepilin-type N-terminal cleavage/methylation domain-containing protein
LTSQKHKSGFTLIEIIVVLAVVAILAAILTPTIRKSINDAKIARAQNELQVIAAAIGSFYKDLGRWPTANGTAGLSDYLHLLVGPGEAPTNAGIAGSREEYWLSSGPGAFTANWIDTFQNHLVENDPKDDSVNYPDNSTNPLPELRWRGPYLNEVKSDPWGSHYSCNIWYTFHDITNFVGVWSAGPDRIAQTDAEQPATTYVIAEDDLVVRLK